MPTTTDTIAVPIAVAITAMDMVMATTAHITARATDVPIMVMDMGVTGATEEAGTPILIRGSIEAGGDLGQVAFRHPDQPAG